MKSIIICGKGYSFKYYKQYLDKYDIKIGYNQNIPDVFDYLFFTISKEAMVNNVNDSILLESELILKNEKEQLKIGSTTFGLYNLIHDCIRRYNSCSIHLVGFDYRLIYDSDFLINNGTDLQSLVNINSQEVLAKKLQSIFTSINIQFVSFDDFGRISPKTGEYYIKHTNDVEIVGEITTNHFGSKTRLMKLIEGAKNAGADSIKLQIRDVESFYNEEKLNSKYNSPFGSTFGDYRNALELDDKTILEVDMWCKKNNLRCFYSVLDEISYNRIMKLIQPNRIKLPSTITNNRDYIKKVLNEFEGELILSTGMTGEEYIEFIMKYHNKKSKIYLLHCISSYPVGILDTNLKMISRFNQLGNNIVAGYSSHDIGSKASVYSVFAGAKMIEKHIKIGNTDFGHFDETALDVNIEFPEFVNDIRIAESILGSNVKSILTCEDHKY